VSQATIDVLTSAAFLTGILAGLAALVVGWLAYFVLDTKDSAVRIGGVLLAVAGVVAIDAAAMIPLTVVAGIGLLAVAGGLPLPPVVSPALAVPGAVVLAYAMGFEHTQATWLLVVVIVAAAPLVAAFDRTYANHALPIPMFALAVVGLFFAVPDTEIAAILLGTMVAGVFLGWPKPFFTLGSAGSYAVVGLFVWVAVAGGAARPASIVVSVGCLGLLLAEPVGRWLSHGPRTLLSDGRVEETAILLVQLAIVYVVSRGAGRLSSAWTAAAVTGLVLGLAVLAVALRTRQPARRTERAGS
jgi:hypothetical protein